jgi:hypothetical protein
MFNNLEYKEKYFKYKAKYLKLQLLLGGGEKTAKDLFFSKIISGYQKVLEILQNDAYLSSQIKLSNLPNLPTHEQINNLISTVINHKDKITKIENEMPIFNEIFNLIKDNVDDSFIDKLVNIYLSGNLGVPNSIENKGRFIDAMEINDILKNNNKGLDINKIISLSVLEDFITKNKGVLEEIERKKKEKKLIHKQIKEDGEGESNIEIILDKPNLKVYHPLTEAGAKYYGKHTRWCTASQNNNMFSYYNKQGPIYIIIINPNSQNEVKFQIHLRTYQIMNSEDSPVTLEFIKDKANDSDLNDFLKKILREKILFDIDFIKNNIQDGKLKIEGTENLSILSKGIPIDLLDDIEVNRGLDILMEKLVNVKSLYFGGRFNKPLDNSLDYLVNLEEITFDQNVSDYNIPLGKSLDKLVNLKSLYFGNGFNKRFDNSLDKLVNLEKLSFSQDASFNQPLGNSLDNLLNLKSLHFGEGFDQPLSNSLDKLVNLEEIFLPNRYIYKGKWYYQIENSSKLKALIHNYEPGARAFSDEMLEYLY